MRKSRIFANPLIGYDEFVGKRNEMMEMLKSADILNINFPVIFNRPDLIKYTFEKAKGCKKELRMSSGTLASRLQDPYFFYRLLAWHCFRNNASGMGFWNYWNEYNDPAATDWNEFFFASSSGMVYKTNDSIVSSKRWEAVREGVEDYEYLSMLKDQIAKLKSKNMKGGLLEEAEFLCASVPEEVLIGYEGIRPDDSFVEGRGRRNAADAARVKILNMLCKLKALEK